MTFRGFLMWVHLVLGVTGAVIVAIVSVTGAYLTFRDPLTRWLNPIPQVAAFDGTPDAQAIVARVEAEYAPRRVLSIDVQPSGEATVVRLRDRSAVFVNPSDGTIVGYRQARFASLENLSAVMGRLHTSLVLGSKGRMVVMIATAEALFLALTGLWLWWRKKHWQFTALRGSWFRVSWDLHNATGIWFLLPVLAMVVTGILLGLPSPVYRFAEADPAPWLSPPRSPSSASGVSAPISLGAVQQVADSARPGEPTRSVFIPADPAGAYAVGKPHETVYVDQFTGAVIEVRPHREPTAGDHAIDVVKEVHTGALFGIPGQAIMTLGCLMLAVMAATGVVLGWKRLVMLAGRAVNGDRVN